MAIRIEESFQVQAPAARVWSYLTTPAEVVRCLPGAELLEVRDERTFVGRVKVKVGPVTATYKGTARFVELDETTHRIRMMGEGQEASGGGSARMTMSSEVSKQPDGAAVRVQVEIDVAGKLVQFGRGMVEEVARQLFQQFASCVRTELSSPPAAVESTVPELGPAGPAPTPPQEPAGVERSGGAAGGSGNRPVNGLLLLLRAFLAWTRRILHAPAR